MALEGVVTGLGVRCLLASARCMHAPTTLDLDDGVAAAAFAVLGIVYGVMLAQLVIAAWGDYGEVQAAVFHEAAALHDLIRMAQGIDEPHQRCIWEAVADYARTVRTVGWPAMARGVEPGRDGEDGLDRLYRLYAVAERESAPGSAFLDASLVELDEVSDARGVRRQAVRWNLHGVLWAALLVQGAIIVSFIGIEVTDRLVHGVVVGVLAAASVLTVVWCLDHPFRGPAAIEPSDFAEVQTLAQRALGATSSTPVGGDTSEPREHI